MGDKVTSARRTPAATNAYLKDAEQGGCRMFICAAELAAHLADAVIAKDQALQEKLGRA